MLKSQGDILLARVYFSNLRNHKIRPVLVVSNDFVNKGEDVLVTKITTVRSKHHSTIGISKENVDFNLDKESEIRCQDLIKLHESFIIKKLGKLDEKSLNQALSKVKENFDRE